MANINNDKQCSWWTILMVKIVVDKQGLQTFRMTNNIVGHKHCNNVLIMLMANNVCNYCWWQTMLTANNVERT